MRRLLIDGVISISTEIKTNLESKLKMDRYYALVIKNDDNEYESRVLNIDSHEQTKDENVLTPTQLYEASFRSVDLSNEGNIKAEIKVYGNNFRNLSNVLYSDKGKEVLPVIKLKMGKNLNAEECFDAYLVTYVYEDGVLVDVYQEYMGFEICYPDHLYFPPGGGGGSGGMYGEEDFEVTHETDNTIMSESGVSEYTDTEGAEPIGVREWTVTWRFGKSNVGGTYIEGWSTDWFQTKYFVNGWYWSDAANQSISTIGGPSSSYFVKDGWAKTFYDSTDIAIIQLTSHVRYTKGNLTGNTYPKSINGQFDMK